MSAFGCTFCYSQNLRYKRLPIYNHSNMHGAFVVIGAFALLSVLIGVYAYMVITRFAKMQ